jgi:hypothetical protein
MSATHNTHTHRKGKPWTDRHIHASPHLALGGGSDCPGCTSSGGGGGHGWPSGGGGGGSGNGGAKGSSMSDTTMVAPGGGSCEQRLTFQIAELAEVGTSLPARPFLAHNCSKAEEQCANSPAGRRSMLRSSPQTRTTGNPRRRTGCSCSSDDCSAMGAHKASVKGSL